MANASTGSAPHAVSLASSRGSLGRFATSFRRFARYQPLGFASAVMLALLGFAAIFSGPIGQYDPLALDTNVKLQSPSLDHWFGTDEFGRDVFARSLGGLRVAFYIALGTAGISTVVGAFIGLVSAYYGGAVDMVVQRVVDMFMSFPAIVLALAIVSVFGQSQENVLIALIVVQTPGTTRVIRASALSLRERMFVEAARSIGASDMRLILRHIMPNTIPVALILATAALGRAVLAEASLSFLGLGVPAPHPSLGSMLSGSARRYAEQAPWLVIMPGLVLSLLVFSANFLGDALRDVIDPRMRGSR